MKSLPVLAGLMAVSVFIAPDYAIASKFLESIMKESRANKEQQTNGKLANRSEYGVKVSEACTKQRKSGSLFEKRFGTNPSSGYACKKITFTCQEKLWHVPEIWRVVVDPNVQAFSLMTGLLGTTEYHRLDRMEPWVIIPVEMTEEIDRKLIIHQEKLSGAMVIKKRVFDKQNGYQDAEYKYYCRSSFGEFKQ